MLSQKCSKQDKALILNIGGDLIAIAIIQVRFAGSYFCFNCISISSRFVLHLIHLFINRFLGCQEWRDLYPKSAIAGHQPQDRPILASEMAENINISEVRYRIV